MSLLGCTLVHHTGTMIRFRPSQLADLPNDDVDVMVELPNRHVVVGHFRRHPANPNISGRALVQYIKRRQPFGRNAAALIDVGGRLWRLYAVEDAVPLAEQARISTSRVRSGNLTGGDLSRLLQLADQWASDRPRRAAYSRLLRPAGLRRMILGLMGTECQVEGCGAAESETERWHDTAAGIAILQVHHIEAIARKADHHPRNVCVICANHHALIHGYGPWTVQHDGDCVVLSTAGGLLRIARDLTCLEVA